LRKEVEDRGRDGREVVIILLLKVRVVGGRGVASDVAVRCEVRLFPLALALALAVALAVRVGRVVVGRW
jgi:hypothetical protein